MNLNTVTFEGNLADDPKLVHVQSGVTAVLEAVVLVNRRTKKTPAHVIGQPTASNGEWSDAEPTRHRIKAWNWLAENIATLPKGSRVLVVGHTETEAWARQPDPSQAHRGRRCSRRHRGLTQVRDHHSRTRCRHSRRGQLR